MDGDPNVVDQSPAPVRELSRGEAAAPLGVEVAPDLLQETTLMVNLFFLGPAGAVARGWVLVDTGLPNYGGRLRAVAETRFGEGRPPAAIILTHGHFDHVGTVKELADGWDVPVYAHEDEMPFLIGKADYPPADPAAGGGLMTLISPLYPRRGIDLGDRVRPLPADGSVPGAQGWRWIHTPGHTPGHVSLFRDADRLLIAGDAFTTVQQESALAVLMQEEEVHGPPAYFTPDWERARQSIADLAALRPATAVTGHGRPMGGDPLSHQLAQLALDFGSQ